MTGYRLPYLVIYFLFQHLGQFFVLVMMIAMRPIVQKVNSGEGFCFQVWYKPINEKSIHLTFEHKQVKLEGKSEKLKMRLL